MKSQYFFLLFFISLGCTTGDSKNEFLQEFSIFVNDIEIQKTDNSSINWEIKQDSLNWYISKKTNYRLSSSEDLEIASLINKFNELKKSSSLAEMKVNFYFENSSSMNGYLKGRNFKQVINRIHGNISPYPVESYFINTKEHLQENILTKINNSDIEVGDVGNSDHQFIFSNAIEKANDHDLSIVVTDGIYSVEDGDIDIISIAIENTFKNSLAKNEIETVVLKMSSEFDGIYYSETCEPGKKAIKINQTRPYYILLFGNSNNIDTALKKIAILDELPGFEKQARFFLTNNLKFNHTILMKGENTIGTFEAARRGSDLIHEIENVERSSKSRRSTIPSNEHAFQLEIAIDYSLIALPDTYLQDSENYRIDGELDYDVISIKNVNEIDRSSKTFKEVQRINNKNNTNFTHILTLKAKENLFGNLNIYLDNNLPTWINETGVAEDCDINGDRTHTFAFDQLMMGISKAYQKVTRRDEYLDINLKIKI